MASTRNIAIAAIVLSLSAPALAADRTSDVIRQHAPKGISTTFYACVDQSNGTVAQAACLSAEKAFQDARLNKAYKALTGHLRDQKKSALLAAQRAWLDFRTKSGDVESHLYGDEPVAGLTIEQNDIFRLCDRANTLESYLAIVRDRDP